MVIAIRTLRSIWVGVPVIAGPVAHGSRSGEREEVGISGEEPLVGEPAVVGGIEGSDRLVDQREDFDDVFAAELNHEGNDVGLSGSDDCGQVLLPDPAVVVAGVPRRGNRTGECISHTPDLPALGGPVERWPIVARMRMMGMDSVAHATPWLAGGSLARSGPVSKCWCRPTSPWPSSV